MKKFSLMTGLSLAVLSLTGCPGNATNTTTGAGANANANTAVVLNANTTVMNSAGNAVNSAGNMMGSAANAASNAMGGAAATDTTPNGFMTGAAYSGNAEIAASKMALEKTKNAEVKQFAQQMIAEHTKANNELKTLAGKKNFTPPTDLDAEHKTMAADMSKLTGEEFDRAYMRGQVADHEKSVALFEAQSNGGTDADAKAFAAKTLPNLKMHLEMAQKLNAKMK